ncbi:SH3 domain-containing protein [Sinorhizobium numidicum]|uniref:SH3 domain-containing protein n=1 Tax=Sinorhizobium numidicum TaxID=680248 RepID=A0ABY8D2A3_9HYPH|nr:SH3 domain-containing protein [Sinorhizobium numidicum]WEX78361.1 SH3 domain-containing protein [Sinorhizobium numidicum]WEX85020.1 SH3 domain-containing protein [Sinorhizobium numidicum]
MKNAFLRAAAVCALLLMPAIAEAAEGFATANVNMRSGPSTRYPAVAVIPAAESVEIHGCLADRPWCDVSFYGGRGWVAGRYVQAIYRSSRVYLEPEYYRPLGIPTVVFQFDRYWDRNYRGRDFYRDRDRWRRGPDWVEENRDSRDWERQADRDRREWERSQSRERREWERDRERVQREWEGERRDDDQWRRRGDEDDQGQRDRRRRESRGEDDSRNVPDCAAGDFRCEEN